ncbi:MAG TPA: hypothetical protein VMV46_08295 [Thermoanaerobaculia bacterium]|nr:hypothetical protein [Thermoanaerobaculia bacterium]
MICPSCEGEYREGITRCPVCDVDLVDALPEGLHQADLVVVFESAEPEELMPVEGALRAAGIPFLVDGQDSVPGESFGGSFDPATHSGRVEVPARRAEEARALLEDFRSSAAGDDQDDGADAS